jgi:hypothetical protein
MNAGFTHLRNMTLAGGSLALCCILSACSVQSRVRPAPLPTTVPDLDWTASALDGVGLEVDQVIVLDSEGSWVRDASWDEYVLTAKNNSQSAIEIRGFELYSDKLLTPAQSSTSREQLEAQTSATLRTLKDVGVIAGAGLVPIGLTVAVVGTGGAMATGAAAAAAATGIVVLLPVALVSGTVYVVKRRHRARDDKVLIQQGLNDRGFNVPQEVAAGMELKKSAFFPVTPSPSHLVLQYAAGGESRDLSLDLTALAGLHLKAPPATNAPHIPMGSLQ